MNSKEATIKDLVTAEPGTYAFIARQRMPLHQFEDIADFGPFIYRADMNQLVGGIMWRSIAGNGCFHANMFHGHEVVDTNIHKAFILEPLRFDKDHDSVAAFMIVGSVATGYSIDSTPAIRNGDFDFYSSLLIYSLREHRLIPNNGIHLITSNILFNMPPDVLINTNDYLYYAATPGSEIFRLTKANATVVGVRCGGIKTLYYNGEEMWKGFIRDIPPSDILYFLKTCEPLDDAMKFALPDSSCMYAIAPVSQTSKSQSNATSDTITHYDYGSLEMPGDSRCYTIENSRYIDGNDMWPVEKLVVVKKRRGVNLPIGFVGMFLHEHVDDDRDIWKCAMIVKENGVWSSNSDFVGRYAPSTCLRRVPAETDKEASMQSKETQHSQVNVIHKFYTDEQLRLIQTSTDLVDISALDNQDKNPQYAFVDTVRHHNIRGNACEQSIARYIIRKTYMALSDVSASGWGCFRWASIDGRHILMRPPKEFNPIICLPLDLMPVPAKDMKILALAIVVSHSKDADCNQFPLGLVGRFEQVDKTHWKCIGIFDAELMKQSGDLRRSFLDGGQTDSYAIGGIIHKDNLCSLPIKLNPFLSAFKYPPIRVTLDRLRNPQHSESHEIAPLVQSSQEDYLCPWCEGGLGLRTQPCKKCGFPKMKPKAECRHYEFRFVRNGKYAHTMQCLTCREHFVIREYAYGNPKGLEFPNELNPSEFKSLNAPIASLPFSRIFGDTIFMRLPERCDIPGKLCVTTHYALNWIFYLPIYTLKPVGGDDVRPIDSYEADPGNAIVRGQKMGDDAVVVKEALAEDDAAGLQTGYAEGSLARTVFSI